MPVSNHLHGASFKYDTGPLVVPFFDATLPDESVEQLDITLSTDTTKKNAPGGLIEVSGFKLSIPFDADISALRAKLGLDAEACTITLKLRSGQTTADKFTFSAFLTKIGGSPVKHGSLAMRELDFAVNTVLTYVAGS